MQVCQLLGEPRIPGRRTGDGRRSRRKLLHPLVAMPIFAAEQLSQYLDGEPE